MMNSFNQHFITAFVVAIVLAIYRWTIRKPAKKLDGGGIELKLNPVLYGLIVVFMIIFVIVSSLGIWFEGPSKEAILLFALGISMFAALFWLLRFLMGRKVIATDSGVLQQKGKRQRYLKWVDVKSVKLDRAWIKLIGESEEVAVAMNLTGLRDFLTLMREKLPAELCGEVVNSVVRQNFGGRRNGI
jgi:hypothetical protein